MNQSFIRERIHRRILFLFLILNDFIIIVDRKMINKLSIIIWIERAFNIYLFIASLAMIVCASAILIRLDEIDLPEWLSFILGFIFFLCYINIIICGFSGVTILLTRGDLYLGLLCISASIMFFLALRYDFDHQFWANNFVTKDTLITSRTSLKSFEMAFSEQIMRF